jgi:hypothetical protein
MVEMLGSHTQNVWACRGGGGGRGGERGRGGGGEGSRAQGPYTVVFKVTWMLPLVAFE